MNHLLSISIGLVLILGVSGAAETTGPQCSIQGHVKDQDGSLVPDAMIVVEQIGMVTTTDQAGFFCLTEVKAGTYHLLVSAAGYHDRHSHPVRVNGGETTVDVVLQRAFRSETVVTATRTEKRLDQVPVRTEVVTSEQIRVTESRTLADAVEWTTGVRVESNCQNCNFSQIRMLGLDGAYTQILVDSQALVSSLAQVYGIEQIPARMIERLEIVKGGGSAIYGSGAVGGVVNVIPREPVEGGGIFESRFEWIDGAPAHSISGSMDWVSPDHESAFTVFGQTDEIPGVDIDGDGFTEVSRRRFDAMGFRGLQYLLDGKARLSMDFTHISEDRRGGNNLDLPEFMTDVAESIDSTRNTANLSWLHSPGGLFDYRLSVAWADTSRETYYGSGGDPNAYGSTENPLWIVDAQFNQGLGSHTLTWGAQYSTDELIDQQPAYDRLIDDTYSNLGLYLQDDWVIAKGWELVFGARIDDFSELDSSIVSPRAALMWSPTPLVNVRASVAQGFRGPQVFDEDLHITQVGGEGQVIRNDPDLEEERSFNWVLGLEWTPLVLGGVGLVEVALFRTELRDLFLVIEDDDPSTDEVEFTRVNYGGAQVEGWEFNLGWAKGDSLQLQLGWVSKRSVMDEADPDFGSNEFFRTPDNYGLATILYRPMKDLELWLGMRYTGEMVAPHYAGWIEEDRLETTPDFLTFDARVAVEFSQLAEPTTKLRLAVGGRNLTNEYQEDLDQGADRDSGYVYGPRMPRSWYATLGFVF